MNTAALPAPPSDIARRKVAILEFKDSLFRTHSIDRNPIFFGNSRNNRFDSADDSYKVLYAGRDAFCAFVESFARAAGTRVITTAELKTLYPSRLDPERHGIALFQDRAPKLKELMRQSWYAPGPQRHLLAEIFEHYGFELIENHMVVSRKPAARARQEGLFQRRQWVHIF